MRRTIKTLLFGGIAALVLLFAVPAASEARPRVVVPAPYYGHYAAPYARYYGRPYYPRYYYGPGVGVYRYGPRYYDYHYRSYGPRGEVRIGPVDVWW